MPLQGTCEIYDSVRTNSKVSFREFALNCADVESLDELKKPNPIYKEEIAKAKERLSYAKNLSDGKAKKEAHEDYISQLKIYSKSAEKKQQVAVKYVDMLVQVAKWKVPSAKYEGLKKLMKDLLEESLDFDCNFRSDVPEEMNGAQYRKELIEKAEKNIKYHQEEYAKGVKRAKSNYTLWVKKLVKSLPAK